MATIQVKLGRRSYPIHIGPGARGKLAQLLRTRPEVGQIVVIADQRVARLHQTSLLEALEKPPIVLRVRPGERSKSLASARRLYDALAEAHIERSDLIVTFGGGVVGDLGGFVAGTWLRGIRFVQVPTTLEAAVDASVGGKTAVNHRTGKNLIGVFHQPSAVFIDLDFLATLPQRDFAAGLGESVKHALVRDAELLSWHEQHADAIVARDPTVVAELIARNCRIKADVVAQDEREHDLRAILNFGHTIGHAIEHALGYALRHGECVGLGILAANDVACQRGLLNRQTVRRVAELMAHLGLPARLPTRVDSDAVVATCHMDKKAHAGTINFVLITAPGQTIRVADITDAEIARRARRPEYLKLTAGESRTVRTIVAVRGRT